MRHSSWWLIASQHSKEFATTWTFWLTFLEVLINTILAEFVTTIQLMARTILTDLRTGGLLRLQKKELRLGRNLTMLSRSHQEVEF